MQRLRAFVEKDGGDAVLGGNPVVAPRRPPRPAHMRVIDDSEPAAAPEASAPSAPETAQPLASPVSTATARDLAAEQQRSMEVGDGGSAAGSGDIRSPKASLPRGSGLATTTTLALDDPTFDVNAPASGTFDAPSSEVVHTPEEEAAARASMDAEEEAKAAAEAAAEAAAMESAALALQRSQRGRVERAELATKKAAAQRLQARWNGMSARRDVEKRKATGELMAISANSHMNRSHMLIRLAAQQIADSLDYSPARVEESYSHDALAREAIADRVPQGLPGAGLMQDGGYNPHSTGHGDGHYSIAPSGASQIANAPLGDVAAFANAPPSAAEMDARLAAQEAQMREQLAELSARRLGLVYPSHPQQPWYGGGGGSAATVQHEPPQRSSSQLDFDAEQMMATASEAAAAAAPAAPAAPGSPSRSPTASPQRPTLDSPSVFGERLSAQMEQVQAVLDGEFKARNGYAPAGAPAGVGAAGSARARAEGGGAGSDGDAIHAVLQIGAAPRSIDRVVEVLRTFADRDGAISLRSFQMGLLLAARQGLLVHDNAPSWCMPSDANDEQQMFAAAAQLFALFEVVGRAVAPFAALVTGLAVIGSQGHVAAVRAAFDLFDGNSDGWLTGDEMQAYLAAVFRVVLETDPAARAQLGLPHDALARSTTEQCFADLGVAAEGGMIRFEQFQAWFEADGGADPEALAEQQQPASVSYPAAEAGAARAEWGATATPAPRGSAPHPSPPPLQPAADALPTYLDYESALGEGGAGDDYYVAMRRSAAAAATAEAEARERAAAATAAAERAAAAAVIVKQQEEDFVQQLVDREAQRRYELGSYDSMQSGAKEEGGSAGAALESKVAEGGAVAMEGAAGYVDADIGAPPPVDDGSGGGADYWQNQLDYWTKAAVSARNRRGSSGDATGEGGASPSTPAAGASASAPATPAPGAQVFGEQYSSAADESTASPFFAGDSQRRGGASGSEPSEWLGAMMQSYDNEDAVPPGLDGLGSPQPAAVSPGRHTQSRVHVNRSGSIFIGGDGGAAAAAAAAGLAAEQQQQQQQQQQLGVNTVRVANAGTAQVNGVYRRLLVAAGDTTTPRDIFHNEYGATLHQAQAKSKGGVSVVWTLYLERERVLYMAPALREEPNNPPTRGWKVRTKAGALGPAPTVVVL